MATENMTGAGGESNNSAQHQIQNPTPRSGRNRTTRPIGESFKEFVDSSPPKEIEAFSSQLNLALGAIAIHNSNQQLKNAELIAGLSTGGGGLRRTSGSQQQKQAATSAGRMLLRRPSAANYKEDKTPIGVLERGLASAGQINRINGRRPSNSLRANRGIGISESCAAFIPMAATNYKPKSSSRRSSRAGSELSISMKLSAQKALAELGEVSDDEDEDWLHN